MIFRIGREDKIYDKAQYKIREIREHIISGRGDVEYFDKTVEASLEKAFKQLQIDGKKNPFEELFDAFCKTALNIGEWLGAAAWAILDARLWTIGKLAGFAGFEELEKELTSFKYSKKFVETCRKGFEGSAFRQISAGQSLLSLWADAFVGLAQAFYTVGSGYGALRAGAIGLWQTGGKLSWKLVGQTLLLGGAKWSTGNLLKTMSFNVGMSTVLGFAEEAIETQFIEEKEFEISSALCRSLRNTASFVGYSALGGVFGFGKMGETFKYISYLPRICGYLGAGATLYEGVRTDDPKLKKEAYRAIVHQSVSSMLMLGARGIRTYLAHRAAKAELAKVVAELEELAKSEAPKIDASKKKGSPPVKEVMVDTDEVIAAHSLLRGGKRAASVDAKFMAKHKAQGSYDPKTKQYKYKNKEVTWDTPGQELLHRQQHELTWKGSSKLMNTKAAWLANEIEAHEIYLRASKRLGRKTTAARYRARLKEYYNEASNYLKDVARSKKLFNRRTRKLAAALSKRITASGHSGTFKTYDDLFPMFKKLAYLEAARGLKGRTVPYFNLEGEPKKMTTKALKDFVKGLKRDIAKAAKISPDDIEDKHYMDYCGATSEKYNLLFQKRKIAGKLLFVNSERIRDSVKGTGAPSHDFLIHEVKPGVFVWVDPTVQQFRGLLGLMKNKSDPKYASFLKNYGKGAKAQLAFAKSLRRHIKDQKVTKEFNLLCKEGYRVKPSPELIKAYVLAITGGVDIFGGKTPSMEAFAAYVEKHAYTERPIYSEKILSLSDAE